MNDILLPIAFSTFPFLPVLLVATFILKKIGQRSVF